MHTNQTQEYLIDVVEAAGTDIVQWLDSNLISAEAFEAASRDDYDAFIDARCQTIDEHVSKLTSWK